MGKLAIAVAASGVIVIVSGVLLSVVLGDSARSLAERFSFEMTSGQRFAYHAGLRFAAGAAIAAAFILAGPQRTDAVRFGLLAASLWFLAYVPGFLLLADLKVFGLKDSVITLAWGLGEVVLAGLAVTRLIR